MEYRAERLFSDLMGKWQKMNNGKTGGNTGLILNETIMTQLAPFTIAGSVAISSGSATKPDDFILRFSKKIRIKWG